MARVRRGDVLDRLRPPVELVTVEDLGGEVEVRSMSLHERLALSDKANADAAASGVWRLDVPVLLSQTVFDADGVPLMSAAEWNAWGAAHEDAISKLAGTALELSGMRRPVADIEKDSAPTRSGA